MLTRRTFLLRAAVSSVVAAASVSAISPIVEANSNRSKAPMGTYKIPNTDLVVSRIAYGCAFLVEANRDPLTASMEARANRLINTAYENGVNFFDNADIYGYGKSEVALGEALKQSPELRDKIVIQSKCGSSQWDAPYSVDTSRKYIVSSVEGSLQRLGIEHLDILLLHQPDALMEPEQVAMAFDELKRSGKVRYFGVSNHSTSQIELLRKYTQQPLVANQIGLNLMLYSRQAATIDYCYLNKIQVQAYSPVRGLLNPPPTATQGVKDLALALANMANQKGVPPAVLALAWLLHHPAGIVPIIGTTNPEHIIENCVADGVTLSRAEWYALYNSAANA